jgi:hypothetical protein
MCSNGTLKENHHLALLCASGKITLGFNVQNVEAVDAELKRRAVNGEKTKVSGNEYANCSVKRFLPPLLAGVPKHRLRTPGQFRFDSSLSQPRSCRCIVCTSSDANGFCRRRKFKCLTVGVSSWNQ